MSQTKHSPKQPKLEFEGEKIGIPTDILAGILIHLPPTDLLNCMTVCRDWLQLISSPDFIRRYISNPRCNGTRILMPSPNTFIDYNYSTHSTNKIQYPQGFSHKHTIILGSCDGLICLLNRWSCKLAVFNPTTGESEIGHLDRSYSHLSLFYWFGHHPYTGEYVLVVGEFLFDSYTIRIEVRNLSCKLKSSEVCSSVPLPLICSQEIGTPLHGNLHWPARVYHEASGDDENRVIAYDFDENKMVEICVFPGKSCFRLSVMDGCLFAIMKNEAMVFEMWIMKEYGVKESWTKFANIEGFESCCALSPLGFLPNGDLILDAADCERFMLTNYCFTNKKKGKIIRVRNYHFPSKAIVCAETLVSPPLICR